MNDVWSCGECGSRRLSGSPAEGFVCLDCGVEGCIDDESPEEDFQEGLVEPGPFDRNDTASKIRCPACFELVARCSRKGGCCVACRCKVSGAEA